MFLREVVFRIETATAVIIPRLQSHQLKRAYSNFSQKHQGRTAMEK